MLKKVDDESLKAICGTDGALYLIFLRYASKFFCVTTVLSMLIVIPIYLTGKANKDDSPVDVAEYVGLSRITILNITADEIKPAIIFCIIFVLYTNIALIMLFFYWKKSLEWRYR